MTPRVLLVEDDPINREFMRVALEALPAQVRSAESQTAALAFAEGHDLWLLDANLPDGSGRELLAQLRARMPGVPALAHTADDSPALHAALCCAGFAGVLVKPLLAEQLRQVVRDTLAPPACASATVLRACSQERPAWDDDTALRALGGNPTHLATLRQLFLAELDAHARAILAALQRGDAAAAHHDLHRLKASAGFVGAARLRTAAENLDRALPDTAGAAEFEAAWQATRGG